MDNLRKLISLAEFISYKANRPLAVADRHTAESVFESMKLPSLQAFLESKGIEPFLNFQEPGADGRKRSSPDDPAGWRVSQDRTDQLFGDGTVFPVDPENNESEGEAFGQAVLAAANLGADRIHIETGPLDEVEQGMMIDLVNGSEEVEAFRADGGKVMIGPDEVQPEEGDDQKQESTGD